MSDEVVEKQPVTPQFAEEWEKNPMKKPRLAALIINACVGESGPRFERAKEILRQISNCEPVERFAKETVRGFAIRKGEPIAAMITMRGEEAKIMLKRLLYAYDYIIKESSFDQQGNFAFGINEHVDIEDAPFDPVLGTIGFNVIVKLERPGYRLKYRKHKRTRIPKKHLLTPEEAMEFIRIEFDVTIN
ncbi:MAG: 50S ribosomal protein L5 [Candidatus Heimdallarchaeota archaeon]|nr:50S ribosomal protein L5 [Candidatus Heimdallarchaeota archaeon]MCK4955574.1 50S ribosomal protein L5 [Candidatus Heimdallarchaeota archaeon]